MLDYILTKKILFQLGFSGKVNENKWDSISDIGVKSGHVLGDATPLFVKLEEEDIAKYKKQLGPSQWPKSFQESPPGDTMIWNMVKQSKKIPIFYTQKKFYYP